MDNGGIVGKSNKPADYRTSGIWSAKEQYDARTSINYTWPRSGLVYSGLVLSFDSGINASAPQFVGGTDTNWYDLTQGRNNGQLFNGVAANTTSNITTNLYFDGTDDYCDFYAPIGSTTTVSVETWMKINPNSGGYGMAFGWNAYDLWNTMSTGGGIGYNTAAGDMYGITGATVTSLGLLGNWKHYVFEMKAGSLAQNQQKIYVNTVSQTLSVISTGDNTTNRNFNGGFGRISGWLNATTYRQNLNVATFNVYNRALTTTEISQNYNATRSRFGI